MRRCSVPRCIRFTRSASTEMCDMHYQRVRQYGSTDRTSDNVYSNDYLRLWKYVQVRDVIDGGCWRWQGSRSRNGYGIVSIFLNGHNTSRRAHRLLYEFLVGPIPEGLTLDHLCRVRDCVNPAHLEPVTIGENIRRGHRARAQADATASAKLTIGVRSFS